MPGHHEVHLHADVFVAECRLSGAYALMHTHVFDVSDLLHRIFGEGVDRVGHWRILAMAINKLIASYSDTFTTCVETRT